jgi:hypothetical protein
MEPRSRHLAFAVAPALAAILGGCGSPSGIALSPAWSSAGVPVGRDLFGHNTVWARDGLGLWDAAGGHAGAAALAEVAELSPGLLRFPGGTRAMRYRFDQVIGATRTPQCDPFRGVLDGTTYGPDEFFTVADGLGADVTWVAPWVDGSPQHTAALATYLRAHAAVKYLEIGNEPYLGLPAGPASGSCGRPSQFVQDERWDGTTRIPTTAADYAAQLATTAALLRPIAPSLRIGAAATSQYDGTSDAMAAVGDVDAQGSRDPWNARLTSDARDAFDFFILHPYDFTVDDDARIRLADRARKTVRDLRAAAPEKGVAITEYGFLFGGGTLLNALVTADMTRMSAEEQLAMTARHILIETDPSGPFADSAAIGASLAKKPGFEAAKLVRALREVALPAASDGTLIADGTLVALPTRDAATQHLAILLIDRRVDDGPARTVRLTLPPGGWRATQRTLTGDTLAATAVSVTDRDLGHTSGAIPVEIGAHSVVILAADAE